MNTVHECQHNFQVNSYRIILICLFLSKHPNKSAVWQDYFLKIWEKNFICTIIWTTVGMKKIKTFWGDGSVSCGGQRWLSLPWQPLATQGLCDKVSDDEMLPTWWPFWPLQRLLFQIRGWQQIWSLFGLLLESSEECETPPGAVDPPPPPTQRPDWMLLVQGHQ